MQYKDYILNVIYLYIQHGTGFGCGSCHQHKCPGGSIQPLGTVYTPEKFGNFWSWGWMHPLALYFIGTPTQDWVYLPSLQSLKCHCSEWFCAHGRREEFKSAGEQSTLRWEQEERGLLVVGEVGEEMKPLLGRSGFCSMEDMDEVGQDVRAPDIGSGERKRDVHQALTIGRKWRIDNTAMEKTLKFGVFFHEDTQPDDLRWPLSFQNSSPWLEEMLHFWPNPCRPSSGLSSAIPSGNCWTPFQVPAGRRSQFWSWHSSPLSVPCDCSACKAEKAKQEMGEICKRKGRLREE